ncbi:PhnD/SsuA/transferrin family substrate-binding protein, partial [Pseudomonas nitroreducens]|uniref:PhnD/SsuA/transferrin family substrate-binding protein n=1 Tax=Pseudomonas nitroreducens TaxID=46680 RepID=UPI001E63F033
APPPAPPPGGDPAVGGPRAGAPPSRGAASAPGQVQQDDFQVVWTSDDIPESPMVWRKNLDPELQKKLVAAFASIKDVPWGDQGLLNGFQPTNDAAYNVVRDTAKVLDLDLRSLK